jgi:histidyl-tRNA synthetase
VIVGENELAARDAQVKNMGSGEQSGVPFDALAGELLRMARQPRDVSTLTGPISES